MAKSRGQKLKDREARAQGGQQGRPQGGQQGGTVEVMIVLERSGTKKPFPCNIPGGKKMGRDIKRAFKNAFPELIEASDELRDHSGQVVEDSMPYTVAPGSTWSCSPSVEASFPGSR